MEKITITGKNNHDGSVSISFKTLDMAAVADFYPPTANGQILERDYLAQSFKQNAILHGIDWEAIQKAWQTSVENKTIVTGVVIARGTAPVDACPAYYELNASFKNWTKAPANELPRLSEDEINPFSLVKKGQIIAKIKPAIEGKNGKNIRGVSIPYAVATPESVTNGPNTTIVEQKIVATTDGRLTTKGPALCVEEYVEIKETGQSGSSHIIFPGDMVITGPVGDGLKIYAGGTIVSRLTFDAVDVVAKKDLFVAGGIVSTTQANIKVGGQLRARFLQNCHISARDSILVSTAIVNSRVYTMDKLDLGSKGRLIGGEVFAINGVKAQSIGAEGSNNAKIHCGIDFTAQQELEILNGKTRQFFLKQKTLSSLPEKNKTAIAKLEDEIDKLSNQIMELLHKVDANDQATVEVSGEVLPGTLIEICHVTLVTDQPYEHVRFRLDKANGCLVSESL